MSATPETITNRPVPPEAQPHKPYIVLDQVSYKLPFAMFHEGQDPDFKDQFDAYGAVQLRFLLSRMYRDGAKNTEKPIDYVSGKVYPTTPYWWQEQKHYIGEAIQALRGKETQHSAKEAGVLAIQQAIIKGTLGTEDEPGWMSLGGTTLDFATAVGADSIVLFTESIRLLQQRGLLATWASQKDIYKKVGWLERRDDPLSGDILAMRDFIQEQREKGVPIGVFVPLDSALRNGVYLDPNYPERYVRDLIETLDPDYYQWADYDPNNTKEKLAVGKGKFGPFLADLAVDVQKKQRPEGKKPVKHSVEGASPEQARGNVLFVHDPKGYITEMQNRAA